MHPFGCFTEFCFDSKVGVGWIIIGTQCILIQQVMGASYSYTLSRHPLPGNILPQLPGDATRHRKDLPP